MKLYLQLLLVTSVSAAVIERRQEAKGIDQLAVLLGGKGSDMSAMLAMLPKAKAVKVVDVEARIRPDAKRQLIRYEALNLPASKVSVSNALVSTSPSVTDYSIAVGIIDS